MWLNSIFYQCRRHFTNYFWVIRPYKFILSLTYVWLYGTLSSISGTINNLTYVAVFKKSNSFSSIRLCFGLFRVSFNLTAPYDSFIFNAKPVVSIVYFRDLEDHLKTDLSTGETLRWVIEKLINVPFKKIIILSRTNKQTWYLFDRQNISPHFQARWHKFCEKFVSSNNCVWPKYLVYCDASTKHLYKVTKISFIADWGDNNFFKWLN